MSLNGYIFVAFPLFSRPYKYMCVKLNYIEKPKFNHDPLTWRTFFHAFTTNFAPTYFDKRVINTTIE